MNLKYTHVIDGKEWEETYPELPWSFPYDTIRSTEKIIYDGKVILSFTAKNTEKEMNDAVDNFFKNMIRKQKLDAL